jgi:hypothetical protein
MSVMWISETLPKSLDPIRSSWLSTCCAARRDQFPKPEAPVKRRCRHGGLNEVAAGNHVFNLRIYSGY